MVPAPRLDADPFAHSVHLSISQLELRNTLPPSTHLTGTISLVWGNLTSKTWSGNAVTCLLKTYISIKSAPRSDLALSVPTEKATLYSFRLLLRPSGLVEANEESLSRMEEERERLLTLVGKLVTIDCSGVKVEKVEKQRPGMLVHLEGVGERQLMSKSTGKIKILAGLSFYMSRTIPMRRADLARRFSQHERSS